MDYKLKELRQKYERLKKSTEKPYERNPDWYSDMFEYSRYQDKLEKLAEAEKAFFEYLKEKKLIKQTRSL